MTEVLSFCRGEEQPKQEPHHYKACGVEGVFLLDGFSTIEDELYGPSVIIEDADGLHKAIGLEIALSRPHLSARDVRFLREQMSKSQVSLANEIGVSEQMIARYEKEDQTDITGPADRLLRALYVTHLFPDQQAEIMQVIIDLYQEGEANVEDMVFSRAQMHWAKFVESNGDAHLA